MLRSWRRRGYRLLEVPAGAIDSLLVARKSIRELAEDPTAMAFEEAWGFRFEP